MQQKSIFCGAHIQFAYDFSSMIDREVIFEVFVGVSELDDR